ncbi:hypothetical protein LTA6_003476 [Microbacterium sp. LTA6]|uniref:hypothetical protein n=1 Tax=unclassified Microbacterium TaxID=2609290 RepID=UPI0031397EBF
MMEQKPLSAAEPLEPPTADVAQAYLDEVDVVATRREERIDRRGIAWVALAEAAALAVYLSVMMFGFGSSSSSSFITLIALLLVWIQLSGELKESFGFQSRLRRTERWAYALFGFVAVAGVVVGIATQIVGADIPFVLRLAPGGLVLLVFGGLAVRDLRRARPAVLRRARAPLATVARNFTLTIGAVFGIAIAITSVAYSVPASLFSMALILLMLGWWIAVQISDRLPALGAVWYWPQWAAFVLGWAVFACAVLVQFRQPLDPLIISIAAVVVVLAFVAAAFFDGRDAD